mmetsp:Transcript_14678/g.15867  ORF Transcript_14678/g.15867 Transcript_14678/m.15867 type:complete len:97 (-) Transcript_14678:1461-1751(-)
MSRRAKKAQQKKPVRRELLLSLNHSEEAFENVIRQIQHIIKRKTCDDEDRSIHFPHIDRGSFKKYIYFRYKERRSNEIRSEEKDKYTQIERRGRVE